MHIKIQLLIVTILLGCFSAVSAQEPADTIYSPNVIFSTMPRTYEIAGIKVTGADNYEDFIVIGYSGLNYDRRQTPDGSGSVRPGPDQG